MIVGFIIMCALVLWASVSVIFLLQEVLRLRLRVAALEASTCVGLKLRVADLDRDLTALEGSLTGDGK